MNNAAQLSLFADEPTVEAVKDAVCEILRQHAQSSAWELLKALDRNLGPKARWAVEESIRKLLEPLVLTYS